MSEQLHQMVGELRSKQDAYMPDASVQRELAKLTLTLLVGPTATGKTTLIQEVKKKDKRFSDVGILSTRAPRVDDPPYYRTDVPISDMLQRIDDGSLVQYHVHPSGDIYASDLESFETTHPILPTMSSSVEKFLKLGFGRIVMVGIFLNGQHWQERLNERQNDPTFLKRLDEAKDSLHWMSKYSRTKHLSDPNLYLVENSNEQLHQAVQHIIAAITPTQKNPNNRTRFNTRLLEMNAIISSLQQENES